jgi:predicted dienelactone hydrolase
MSRSLADLAERGPHPVGLLTLELPDPEDLERTRPTDVWYPAAHLDDAAGSPPDHPFGQPHRARLGLPPAQGPHPLVAFSHGNSGLSRQSTFLTTHLASWGMVVAGPDHSGNTFFEMLPVKERDDVVRVHLNARRNRPRDIDTVIETLLASRASWPEVDPKRVGILGHSYGGWTALKMPARNPRVGAVCGLAPASEPFVGRKAFEAGELPFARSIPTLLVAGVDDVLVDLETSVRPLFERLTEPRALVSVEGAAHFHFCDGTPLLHGFHEQNPRDNQPRPTRPYADLLPEDRMHRLLRALVTHFFRAAFEGRADACSALSSRALRDLDRSLQRLA